MNLDKLEKLSSLKEKGIITQEEFDNQKKIILGQSNVFKSNKAILDFSKYRDIWNNYLKCFKKYFQFSGRATRYEFWGFTLINVLVSLGNDGALLLTKDNNTYYSKAPRGQVVSTVGSGDSMVAGFLAGYYQTQNYEHALKTGVAAGSASAFSVELATKEDVDLLLKQL